MSIKKGSVVLTPSIGDAIINTDTNSPALTVDGVTGRTILGGVNGGFRHTSVTTAQRNAMTAIDGTALGVADAGLVVWNSTTLAINVWSGSAWLAVTAA